MFDNQFPAKLKNKYFITDKYANIAEKNNQ